MGLENVKTLITAVISLPRVIKETSIEFKGDTSAFFQFIWNLP